MTTEIDSAPVTLINLLRGQDKYGLLPKMMLNSTMNYTDILKEFERVYEEEKKSRLPPPESSTTRFLRIVNQNRALIKSGLKTALDILNMMDLFMGPTTPPARQQSPPRASRSPPRPARPASRNVERNTRVNITPVSTTAPQPSAPAPTVSESMTPAPTFEPAPCCQPCRSEDRAGVDSSIESLNTDPIFNFPLSLLSSLLIPSVPGSASASGSGPNLTNLITSALNSIGSESGSEAPSLLDNLPSMFVLQGMSGNNSAPTTETATTVEADPQIQQRLSEAVDQIAQPE